MLTAAILFTLIAVPIQADDTKSLPKFTDVAWLAGGWKSGPDEKTAMEELWQGPANETMAGVFRMSSAKSAMYEFLLLEEKPDGVWMRLRHYGAEMKDLDEKPARLKLTEASEKRLLFVNPDNNKPKRVVYEREGATGLTVAVETERDGKPVKFSLKFNKVESK